MTCCSKCCRCPQTARKVVPDYSKTSSAIADATFVNSTEKTTERSLRWTATSFGYVGGLMKTAFRVNYSWLQLDISVGPASGGKFLITAPALSGAMAPVEHHTPMMQVSPGDVIVLTGTLFDGDIRNMELFFTPAKAIDLTLKCQCECHCGVK